MLQIMGRPLEALGYYFDAEADERDHDDSGGGAARYRGEVATALGLFDQLVRHDEFSSLLSDPFSILNASGVGIARRRHAFYDVVFPLPKSVSLLFALGTPRDRQVVVAAQIESRDETLRYLERHGLWVREPAGARASSRADGMMWAAWRHHISRSNDPHLHSHVVIANRAPSLARGWSTLDFRAFHDELTAASALHAASLRYELSTHLGVGFRDRTARNSDVAGFSDRVIESFSSRMAEINRNGGDAVRERPTKHAEPELDELLRRWGDEARAYGQRVRQEQRVISVSSRHLEGVRAKVDALAEEVVARFRSPFLRQDLVVALCEELRDGAPVGMIADAAESALLSQEGRPCPAAAPAHGLGHRPLRRFTNATTRAAIASTNALMAGSSIARLAEIAEGAAPWPESGEVHFVDAIESPLVTYGLVRALRARAAMQSTPLLVHSSTAYSMA